MTEIYRSEYWHLTLEHGGQIVRATRTSTAYQSIQAFLDDVDVIVPKLDAIGRAGRCLLTDIREGPGRNDEAFEQAIAKAVPGFSRGFRRDAVLVRTVVGSLQVKRYPGPQGKSLAVFLDEAAAVEWLLTGRP